MKTTKINARRKQSLAIVIWAARWLASISLPGGVTILAGVSVVFKFNVMLLLWTPMFQNRHSYSTGKKNETQRGILVPVLGSLTNLEWRLSSSDILQEIMDTCKSDSPGRSSVKDLDDHEDIPNPFSGPVEPKLKASGAIIIGNPGIGKSVFLAYILALRVLAGKTTVFQSTNTHFYVLNSEGVFHVPFPIISENINQYIERGTWCLFDSNRTLKDPPECFTNLRNWFELFIVQATPPSKSRVHWSWKAGIVPHLWMAPWSLGELIAARDIQIWTTPPRRPTEQQLLSFCKLYGTASPLLAFSCASSPAIHELAVNYILDKLNKYNFPKFLTDARVGSDSYSDSDYFVVATPNPEGTHTDCRIEMVSEPLAEKVLDQLRKRDKDAALFMYWNFIIDGCTRRCAKYFLEKAFLEQFPRGGKWTVSLMNRTNKTDQATGGMEIHWERNASWSNKQYLLLGYKSSASPVKITAKRPFPVPRPEEFSLTYREIPPNSPLKLEDGFFRPTGANDQTTFDPFIYDASTQTATLFHLTVEKNHKLVITSSLTLLKDAKIVDLVIVTCPNKLEGTEDVYMRQADYDEVCKGEDNDKLRDVYLLELDAYP